MSIRQYIGARYVPRFSDVNNGNWSSVYSYEPLIIVKNGNDYYTSKKSVPVGIQITNTEYWVKTGDYNGAISSLDTRLTAAEDSIENLYGTRTNITPVILVGDSYGTNNGAGITLNHNVAYYLQERTRDQFEVYDCSRNGAGFCNGYFLSQLQSLASQITKKDEVSDIIVFGGWNDAIGRNGQTTSQLQSAMQSFEAYCRSTYPNAKLHLMFLAWTFATTSEASGITTTYEYYKLSERYGFAFHDNMTNVLHRRSLTVSDLIHPNESGVEYIARYMLDTLFNGTVPIINEIIHPEDDFEASGSATAIGNFRLREVNTMYGTTVEPDVVGSMRAVGSFTIPAGNDFMNTRFEVATLKSTADTVVNCPGDKLLMNGTLTLAVNDARHYATGALIYRNNKLYLYIATIPDSLSSGGTATRITINPGTSSHAPNVIFANS